MEGFKSLVQSRTFWANAIGIVSLLVPPAGAYVGLIDPDAIAEAVSNGVAVAAFVMSTYYRLTATKRIA